MENTVSVSSNIMMKCTTISLFLSLFVVATSLKEASNFPALSDALIDHVNNLPGNTWKAARTDRFKHVDEIRQLLGALKEPPHLKQARRPTVNHENVNVDLPKNFDARENWPKCETIPHIRDQSSCGSCWAFGAATAMSDRVCIHSGQKLTNVKISTTDLLSCCRRCGYGCRGGYLGPAWDFWRGTGLVTGGDFEDTKTCRPYPFAPCDHHVEHGRYGPCPKDLYPTPRCTRECGEESHLTYGKDKIRAKSSYNVPSDAVKIQTEIFKNGPVEAAFDVYADFSNYKTGVYQHVTGEHLGGHAIRIIGWGEDNGTPYWLIANSWNDQWGDNGLFRILRGENHCGIEEDVTAGIPVV